MGSEEQSVVFGEFAVKKFDRNDESTKLPLVLLM